MRKVRIGAVLLLLAALSPQLAASRYGLGGSAPASSRDRDAVTDRTEQQLSDAQVLLAERRYSLARGKITEAVSKLGRRTFSGPSAEALKRLAAGFSDAGYFQEAVYCLRRLLEDGPPSSSAVKSEIHISLAELYFKLSRPETALSHYKAGLALGRAGGHRSEQRRALAGLARVYALLGDVTNTTIYLARVQRLESAGADDLEAHTLELLGAVYRERGEAQEARRMLEASLQLFRRTGSRNGQILVLASLSDLELTCGHESPALDYARASVKLASEDGVPIDPRWRAWLALGRAQRASADERSALASYFRAFGLVEAQNVTLTADQLKVAVLSERQCVYRELADLYVSAGRSEEAFRVADHGRARATLDLLRAPRSDREAATPEQKAALQAISSEITGLDNQLRSRSLNEAQRAAAEEAVREAARKREGLELDIQTAVLKRFTRPVDVEALKGQILGPGEVLAEFLIGESRSHLWLVTRDAMRCVELPSRRAIEDQTASYLRLLASRPSSLHFERDLTRLAGAASRLFDMLLGGAAQELNAASALTFVADGPLYYLPFETLVREGRYLIEDYDIGYAPSAGVLSFLRQSSSGVDGRAQREVIAFGDPILGGGRARMIRRARGQDRTSEPFEPGVPARLPNSAVEITGIAKLFPEGQSSIYLGPEATERALKRAALNGYRRLHFATHAVVDDTFPAHSGLIMSRDDGQPDDGLLDISEIASLNLDCDLVVLSACGTARGKLVLGEGLLGLTRAFLYAGARSLAVTLWDVSDFTTAALVTSFYRHIASGRSNRAALRQSKIDLIRRGGLARHPYYWGPLILVGAAR